MSFTNFDKKVHYSGYDTSGEFNVKYAFDQPLQIENDGASYTQHNQNGITATTKFAGMNDANGEYTEMRIRQQKIDITIPDKTMESETAKRSITIEYGEDWHIAGITFEGEFTDDAGKRRTMEIQMDSTLRPETSVLSPSGVLTFVDGYAQGTPHNADISKETWSRAFNTIYDFCTNAWQEVEKMQDAKGNFVMDVQLTQLRDYEHVIEFGRRKIEQKHAVEAAGYKAAATTVNQELG